MAGPPRVVALSGGVGGARLADGLARRLPAERLTIVVNTADDFRRYGLHISPDVDTVLYTLAGRANPATGWGLAGDSDQVMRALIELGDDAWFQLGDRDLATHLARTAALAEGLSLTTFTYRLAAALGVGPAVLPMSDEPVATIITTAEGDRDFQTWFVRQRCQPEAVALRYAGAAAARPTAAVLRALAKAQVVVVGPSNPFLSIGPMLALDGFRVALAASPATKVAVSPVIAGQALKGPATEMLRRLAGGSGALDVARLYAGLLDGFVVDTADAAQVPPIEALGMKVLATDIRIPEPADRARLAAETLAFAGHLAAARAGA